MKVRAFKIRPIAIFAAATLTCARLTRGENVDFFEKNIRPILVENCYSCHSAQARKLKGDLLLDTREGVLHGGRDGVVLIPGDPEHSKLIEAVRWTNSQLKMPPRQRLTAAQVADLETWVKQGAADPRTGPARPAAEFDFAAARKQWAFHPPVEPAIPPVKREAWCKSPIDRFILARLEEKGLSPAPPAEKPALIRRAYFDLIGLPPTPQEVEAFLADAKPDAFAKVVDRLLASPQYGVRWARHWLDVVRYTDSFDARAITSNGDCTEAWRYRDWVVNAFNQDLPYDQFIIQQVAGDLLPDKGDGTPSDHLIATGMYVIGNWPGGDADRKKMLTDIVDDQIDVTGRAFLGLTLACARCHDHKFDPIPTADYYGLAGIFFSSHFMPAPGSPTAGGPILRFPLAPPEEVAKHKAYDEKIAALQARLAAAQKAKPASPAAQAQLAELKQELATLQKNALPPLPGCHGMAEGGVPGGMYEGIHDGRIHIRGRYDRQTDVVPRHFPRLLAGDGQSPISQGSGRLELARFLASSANPLTARVIVNRLWQHHFDDAIVRTPNNYGKLGRPPTHPELLDYLAVHFMNGRWPALSESKGPALSERSESKWSIKAMQREIMLSATYQQSAIPTPATLAADPDNLLFGWVKRRRLEAESIRDSLLAQSGALDPMLGGPSIRDASTHRRTIYLTTIRSERSDYRTLFDAADATAIVDQRIDSTVAPQALFLLNNPFVLEQAKLIAARAMKEGPADERAKIDWLYRRLYSRGANKEEIDVGIDLLRQSQLPEGASAPLSREAAWEAYCQVLVCANEFVYVD